MRGVPPGGKVQLLHMVAEENEWSEQEVEFPKSEREAIRPILRDFN